jgi:hypothetical protein
MTPNEKAVQDNITESWLCIDCGVNTHPGTLSGPEMRIALALNGEVDVHHTEECEVYSVRNTVWKQAGMKPWGGCLCVGCLEKRIGRRLRPKDFDRHDAEVWARLPCTDRLLDRRGARRITVRTKNGEKEIIIDRDVAAKIMALTAPGELPWMDD